MTETVAPSQSDSQDIRPVIATGGGGRLGLWAFLLLLLVGGAWLFSLMSTARLERDAPLAALPAGTAANRIAAPPPIALPARFGVAPGEASLDPFIVRRLPSLGPATRPGEGVTGGVPRYPAPPQRPIDFAPAPITYPVPAVQPATGSFGAGEGASGDALVPPPLLAGERVSASRLGNPALTVPLGTIIPAVLETALDSTRPGFVRALVQRNVASFDGTRVLIPRGSRLYGEYQADLERGQNRALIRWTRLLRPDGVIVALDSPVSDPLGRAGVKGKVDSKFFQRFGNAILQSALDIGVGIATRSASDGVVVALPGSTTNISGNQAQEVRPTLKVRHGTSVSVYVARDLDFSTVDG